MDFDLVRRTDNMSAGRETNRISPFENSQRAECIEGMRDTAEGLMPLPQPLLHAVREALLGHFNAMSSRANKRAAPPGVLETERQIVHTLAQPPDPVLRNKETAAAHL